ncbi:HTH-type transcriptional repressor YvoA [Abditibacteriota bacterium]|nr:HTH-type transcriptional repressor YvoA [Abditibacteriota bacterium]
MESSFEVFEKTKDRPLHEQVREHLRTQCLNAQPDVALPPLRQMSESLGVNHLTISRALRDLEAEGLLRVVPGKGTFVAKTEPSHQAIEMVTLHTNLQDLLDTSRHTFKGMQDGLTEGFSLAGSTLMVPPVPRADTFLQGLKARQVAAVAFFGFGYLSYPNSFLEAQFIHEVAEQVPVVLIGKEHSLLKLDCVYCDPAPQMRTFLEECFEQGMRRFEYLGANDNQPHLKHRLWAFQEFLLSHSLFWKYPTENSNPTSEIHQLLDAEPEVIVVSTPYKAHQLVVEAQQRGLKLGHDLQILCFTGSLEEVRAIASYVTVIVLEEEEVGRCAVHRLSKLLEGSDKPSPISRRVPGKLVRQDAAKSKDAL